MTTEDLLNYYYRSDAFSSTGARPRWCSMPSQLFGAKVSADVRDPKCNEVIVKEGKKFTRPILRQMEAARIKHVPIALEEILGRVAAHDIVDPQTKKCWSNAIRRSPRKSSTLIREKGIHSDRSAVYRRIERRPLPAQHVAARPHQLPPRCDPGDLPALAAGRSSDGGVGDQLFSTTCFSTRIATTFPKSAGLKLNHRLKLNIPLEQGTLAQRGYPRGRALPDGAQKRQRLGRRYRSSRQSPGARGRRARRKPLPRRPGAHGARDQGKDEPAGHRNVDAAGADQLQAGFSGAQGVFRLEPAVAVHGSDQPALGDHPQAAALGSRSRRSDARARRFRSARRASDPLRPGLSDRNAGRSEHRLDRFADHLCAGQRFRLYRDALPRSGERPG